MRTGLKYSLILHICIILLAIFGLPYFIQDNHKSETIIAIDIIKEAQITNLKNQKVNDTTKKDETNNGSTTKSAQQITAESSAQSSPPIEQIETKEHQKKDVIDETKDKKIEKKEVKPEKKDKPVPKPDKKPKQSQLDNLLKDLEKTSQYNKDKVKKNNNAKNNQGSTNKLYDENSPLSISEKDNIKTQIERKFVNPIVQDFTEGEIVIKLRLDMSINGDVKDVVVLNSSKYPAHYADIFLTLKESLIRAAHMASPLQNLPQEKYAGQKGWQEIELTFDAYFLMNG